MTTTEPTTPSRSRRRLGIGGVVVLLVALLVGGWWWATSRALDQVNAPFSSIECPGTTVSEDDLVVVRPGTRCTLGIGVSYEGRLPVTVRSVHIPYYGTAPVRSVKAGGRTPSAGTYAIGERLRNDESGYRIYRVVLAANPDACFRKGSNLGSDWPVVKVSVLGRHRTISAERNVTFTGDATITC